MMLAWLLLLGAAMVGFCHLLPHTPAGRSYHVALLLFGGFILAEAGLSAAISGLGLVPKGPFHDRLHELADYDGERPVVLLVGSSFSSAAIDPEVPPKYWAAPDGLRRCRASRLVARRISSDCTT